MFVVEQGGKLAGVVSRKDLLKAAMGGVDMQKIPVKVLMTPLPKLLVAFSDEPVIYASKKLIEGEVDSIPVVRPIGDVKDKQFEVIGRFTKTNIARLFVELGEGKGGNYHS